MIATATIISSKEKPWRFFVGRCAGCFTESFSSKSNDHFDRDGYGKSDWIRAGLRVAALGRHGNEVGVAAELFDIPADVVNRLAVAGGSLAGVVRHGITGYRGLREIDGSSARQRRAGSAAGAGRGIDGVAGGRSRGIAIRDASHSIPNWPAPMRSFPRPSAPGPCRSCPSCRDCWSPRRRSRA